MPLPRRSHPAPSRVAVLVVLLTALALPAAASAHARLETTSPPAGADLRRAPRTVSLRFDEAVESAFGALRVLDERGRRVDDAHVTRPGGPSRLAVGLPRDLGNGTYTVTYRVVSDEGHPVSGTFAFQVGTGGPAARAALAAPAGEGAGPGVQRAYDMTRTVGYLALAVGVGTLLFLMTCWLPALRGLSGAESRWRDAADALAARWRVLWLGSVVAGAVGAVLGLILQGATAAGTSFAAALDPAVLQQVLDTRAGQGWLARLGAWAAVACIVEVADRERHAVPHLRRVALGADGFAVAGPSRGALAAMGAGCGVLVATPALAGHAAVQSPVAVLFPLDVVHVAAMCAWLGGLTSIVVLVPAATRRLQADERAQVRAAVLARFSPVALVAVVALAATGVTQAALHLHRVGALTAAPYGRAVLIKVALFAALVGLGALNRRRTLPRLRAVAAGRQARGAAGAARTLRAAVWGEIALLVAVLSVTGALVSYAPPSSAAAHRPVEAEASTGTMDLHVDVAPARPGANRIDLYAFRSADGLPDGDLHHVSFTATPSAPTGEPVSFDAQRVGPGHLVATDAPLTAPGTWTLRMTNHMPGMREETATVEVPIR